jgi:EamA domain-containing membrane protein RarD
MTTVNSVKAQGKQVAKEAAYSPLMDRLARLGYAVKGIIYIMMGFLAFRGALGKSSTPADQFGAIAAFGKLPHAQIFLWVILIGLVSYSLWGLIRAFLDPFHKGSDMKGLLARGGYLLSGITYATFVIPTYQLIKGARS